MTYVVRVGGTGESTICLDEPECLYCGKKNFEPSMDGPLVCGLCDMGINEDGSKWTVAQWAKMNDRFAHRVGEIRRQQQP